MSRITDTPTIPVLVTIDPEKKPKKIVDRFSLPVYTRQYGISLQDIPRLETNPIPTGEI